jgi:alpha-maltose-1-phosphate synthase
MRILFIQLSGRGGTQLYTAQLANAISKNIKDSEVYVLLGNHLFEKGLYDEKVKLVISDSPISYYKMLLSSLNPFTYIKLIKEIKNIDPDVIHITYEFLWDSLALQFLKKYPVIVTLHDPSIQPGTKLIVKLYLGTSRLLMKKRYNKAIVHGVALKNVLMTKGFRENDVKIIPHGEYSYYKKWQKGGIEETRSILFFGLIREYKGLEYLIKAEPVIRQSIPDVKIIIAGEGDFDKYRPLIADQGSFEIINKFIPDEEVAGLFQRSCVVVLPYIAASQTGVIPIAYAFKKPVVATNVGSIPEIVDDGITGFLVPPRDHVMLADRIIKIIKDDNLRKTMGDNGYNKTKKELSWSDISLKTYGLYSETISGYSHE